jgi:hypothetical protein
LKIVTFETGLRKRKKDRMKERQKERKKDDVDIGVR